MEIKVPDIDPAEVGHFGMCFKQEEASMERCTKPKGHEERGDPKHTWEER